MMFGRGDNRPRDRPEGFRQGKKRQINCYEANRRETKGIDTNQTMREPKRVEDRGRQDVSSPGDAAALNV